MVLSRREALKLALAGSAAVMLPLERTARTKLQEAERLREDQLPRPFRVPLTVPPVLAPVRSTADTDFYEITMKPGRAEIVPGTRTEFWGYNGIYPGPTLKVRRGRPVVVRQINALPARHPVQGYIPWTSTHLHGSASLPQYDGYASDITRPGQYKDYHYPNVQDARTLWYHDHGVHHTAQNVYMGLVAQYQMHDELEESLPIPKDRYDVPLMIQDAIFARDGSLIYDDESESSIYGDVILVNGRPWPVMAVERRKYRFRILNCSVSRSYHLALNTGQPFTVIGTDAGLMPRPQVVRDFRHGMAERYEVVIDFAQCRVGQRVVLRNLGPDNNVDYDSTRQIMAFDVVGEASDTANNEVPEVLNPDTPVMALQESDAVRTRRLRFERKHSEWTINGDTWADVINSRYRRVAADPGLGDVEIWELENTSGGWFHPIHIHLIDFKILDRNGRPPMPHERGPKDVAYVGENEVVRVIARYGPQRGRYMIHCHNLVHEDHDMMVQFEVGTGGDDPIAAAPAAPLPAPPL